MALGTVGNLSTFYVIPTFLKPFPREWRGAISDTLMGGCCRLPAAQVAVNCSCYLFFTTFPAISCSGLLPHSQTAVKPLTLREKENCSCGWIPHHLINTYITYHCVDPINVSKVGFYHSYFKVISTNNEQNLQLSA